MASDSKLRSVMHLMQYLWPNDYGIRFRVVFSLFCLVIGKLLSMLIPVAYKHAVDDLSSKNTVSTIVISILISYGLARISSQIFNELRDSVFAKVGQRGVRMVALTVFEHMHSLSMRFHITRKTGGVSRSIERGTKAIEAMLRYALHNIIPTIFEIVMVSGMLWYVYGLEYAITTIITMVAYVVFTLLISEWRTSFVKQMNSIDNASSAKAVDSLMNFETVKYFSNEAHESQEFNQYLLKYENASVKSSYTLSMLNIGQGVIISIGLVVIMILAANGIRNNNLTAGDFVLLNTYIIQLSVPLNMLGFAYREIKSAILNIHDMFMLLDIPQEVQDVENATALTISKGEVVFRNVGFSYNENRTILYDINFIINAGKSLAIVGASGAGKSTISRLLFRFYDINHGAIEIDGQDIRNVTQDSLRKSIGIVPQDTVLFNDTIFYNIAYGNFNASYEEVIAASKRAHIHDFIMSLPEQYDSLVGERGLKLSGGEKQRVAIARTILKNPRIYIFDEATSALDTNTEKMIQASLKEISENKTTLIIAHRLSTIIHADEIVVIDGGHIIGRGSHKDLLSKKGLYFHLWSKQQEESR